MRPDAVLPVLPWDQALAERLLKELRAEVQQAAVWFGGKLPPVLGTLLVDAVVLGERYARDHEAEAARGWDAMTLLQELVPHVWEITERWWRVNKAKSPRIGENQRRRKLCTYITMRPIL